MISLSRIEELQNHLNGDNYRDTSPLLLSKRLREERRELAAAIHELADKAISENRVFHSEEEEVWNSLNSVYDRYTSKIISAESRATSKGISMSKNTTLGREDFIASEDENRDVSAIDLAIAGWCKSQAGIPIGEELAEACRSVGVSTNSSAFDIQMQKTNPRRASEWFVRHTASKDEHRALNTLVGLQGGATVPEGFIPRFEKAMLDFSGVMQSADVMVTSDGRDLPWPTSDDTGNEGELVGENTAVGEQDVEFGQTIFRSYKLTSKLVRLSSELMEDSAPELAAEHNLPPVFFATPAKV